MRIVSRHTVSTTDATVTTVANFGALANQSWFVKAWAHAAETDGSEAAYGTYSYTGALFHDTSDISPEVDEGSVDLQADTTGFGDLSVTLVGGEMVVRVTGVAATNLSWFVTVERYLVDG